MTRFDDAVLQEEVEELTAMPRHDEVLTDRRALLQKYGHDPAQVLLAGFVENADSFEGGAIVTSTGEAYEFERADIAQKGSFSRWQRVTDVNDLLRSYPAVRVSLQMVR